MVNSLYFNNKDSWKDLDLLFVETPSIPISLENVENIEVDGRNGTLTRKLGTYKDKVIPIKFRLNTKDELYYNRIQEIEEWMNVVEDKTMIFSFYNERKLIVKSIQATDIKRQLEWYGEFEITFTYEPFSYPLYEDSFETTDKIFKVYNTGNIYCEPYYKLTGNGDITIKVNNNNITITGVSGYIELDSNLYLCWKDIYNYTNNMTGKFEFLHLQKGENNIEITGDVSKIEINLRTRYR
ncbi:distal tail protein Dit [Clostridium sp. C8-1-8]|uniref:distal tail protein Dit n=1 Tax=Clostridium sp. C8-1-8 TaxID=2698831 RepID=UPI00136949B2|nr:distal tail protein Dit [Clostridium sp. C8-1-8]